MRASKPPLSKKQYNPLEYEGEELILHMAYAHDINQVLKLEKKVIMTDPCTLKFAFIKLL